MSGVVLVTGAGGYVGGRVAEAIARVGWPLRLVTRKTAVLRAAFPSAEIVSWPERPEPALFDELCRDVQAIVHLAAMNEIECAQDPERAVLVNTFATLQLLRAAERRKVQRFIFFSTGHVYGAPLEGTLTERSLPRPAHPYAITHLAAEEHVLAAHDRKSITAVVLRLSNSVGAPLRPDVDRWTLLANDLVRQAVTTGQCVLRSSGRALRDFIPMSDVCRAVDLFLALPRESIGDGVFNVGGGCTMPVLELTNLIVDRCERSLGFRPKIVRPSGEGEPLPGPLDFCIDKLLATGFRLTGSLEVEIDETLAFCQRAFGRPATGTA